MQFVRVRSFDDSDAQAVSVTLYRKDGLVRGWYVGPPRASSGTFDIPYAAKSANLMAPVAILRAHSVAVTRSLVVCIIDPDDLWDEAWAT